MSTCIRVAERGGVFERVRLVMVLDSLKVGVRTGRSSEGRRNGRRRRGGIVGGRLFGGDRWIWLRRAS